MCPTTKKANKKEVLTVEKSYKFLHTHCKSNIHELGPQLRKTSFSERNNQTYIILIALLNCF